MSGINSLPKAKDLSFEQLKENLKYQASKSGTFSDTLQNLAADVASMWLPWLGQMIRNSSSTISKGDLVAYITKLMKANAVQAQELTQQLANIANAAANQSGTHSMQQTGDTKERAKQIKKDLATNQADATVMNMMADNVNRTDISLANKAKNISDMTASLANNYEERIK